MDSPFILLGLAADPQLHAAESVSADDPESGGPLTYRETAADYTLLAIEFLLEGGLELLVELPFEIFR